VSEKRTVSDEIIDNGPYVVGDLNPLRLLTAAQLNELREELMIVRELRKVMPGVFASVEMK
jgi:hypothetical protein